MAIKMKIPIEKDMHNSKRKFFESLGVICVPMNQDDIFNLEKYLSGK